MRTLVYDIETLRLVRSADCRPEDCPGVEFAEGWSDFPRMGIACLCAIEMPGFRPWIFSKKNLAQLPLLIEGADRVIGYNSWAFDEPLLAANGIAIPADRSFDLAAGIAEAVGIADPNARERHRRYGLQAMAKANDLGAKRADSALAPVLWQRGEALTVVDLCLGDAFATACLLHALETDGVLSFPDGTCRPVSLRSRQARDRLARVA